MHPELKELRNDSLVGICVSLWILLSPWQSPDYTPKIWTLQSRSLQHFAFTCFYFNSSGLKGNLLREFHLTRFTPDCCCSTFWKMCNMTSQDQAIPGLVAVDPEILSLIFLEDTTDDFLRDWNGVLSTFPDSTRVSDPARSLHLFNIWMGYCELIRFLADALEQR